MTPFQQILAEEAAKSRSGMKTFKRTAQRLKDAAGGALKLGQCQQLLAQAYGYNTLAHLQSTVVDGQFERNPDAKVPGPHPARQG